MEDHTPFPFHIRGRDQNHILYRIHDIYAIADRVSLSTWLAALSKHLPHF
jgi:hypothetical protein